MQVAGYAESLSSSSSGSSAVEAQSIFLESPAEAALPERPAWIPEMLSGFAADKLLMPLGGLGTDRCETTQIRKSTPWQRCETACSVC